ncbi:MAG: ornithine carbamoyltransferase [Promethearchaeota archaeon]
MDFFRLTKKDLITTQEWSMNDINTILEWTRYLKDSYYKGEKPKLLPDKTFLMLFYSISTRTRISFETAMTELGGHAQFVEAKTTLLDAGESVKDTAKVMERYAQGIGIRLLEPGIGNKVIREYANHVKIPVINMADDRFHPCQGLGDIFTLIEKIGDVKHKKLLVTWGYSNNPRSWCSVQSAILIATRFGMDVTLAYPSEHFALEPTVIEWCKNNVDESGGAFEISNDLQNAYNSAHVVFPRNWMTAEAFKIGIERELEFYKRYRSWMCTPELMESTDKAIFLHSMPVFREEEASSEVVDAPYSVIYDQAENRLHVQKAILSLMMGGIPSKI